MGFKRVIFFALVGSFMLHYYVGVPDMTYALKVKFVKYTAFQYSGYKYSSRHLRENFAREYPRGILRNEEWIQSNTGGLQGSVSILYASLREILVLYHAEVETSGNTGRHLMNISATVLKGGMTYSSSNLRSAKSLAEGENTVFRMGDSSVVKLSSKTTILIYGRGYVPLTMGYWLSDSLFSLHDPILAINTIWMYIKAASVGDATFWEWLDNVRNYLLNVSQNGVQYFYESGYHTVTHIPETLNSLLSWLLNLLVDIKDKLVSLV